MDPDDHCVNPSGGGLNNTTGSRGGQTLHCSHIHRGSHVSGISNTSSRPGDAEDRREILGEFLTVKSHPDEYRQSFLQWQESVERAYDNRHNIWFRRWKDKLIIIMSYLAGILCFMVFFHLQVLPELPYPLTGNLADWMTGVVPVVWWPEGAVLILTLWGLTHLRRILTTVIQTATVKDDTLVSKEPRPFAWSSTLQRFTAVLVFVYHVFFGAWLGWANNVHTGYWISDLCYVIAGLVLFLTGETTTLVGLVYFACKKRKEPSTFRNTRLGFEACVWLGFCLVSMTLPSVLIFLARLVTIVYVVRLPERPTC